MTGHSSAADQATGSAVARRTRRQLLAGGTGALAVVLSAEALARPAPASAANGDPVILGADNYATAPTVIINSADAGQALACVSNSGPGVIGIGVAGVGVAGESHSDGNAVEGLSSSGRGVYGQSGITGPGFSSVANGVHGVTDSAAGVGVIGENANGTAVGGISGTSDGVGGTSTSGTGVHGVSSTGIGVLAECPSGIGVRATGSTALSIEGPAVFSRSGILAVPAKASMATMTGVALSATSLVLATLQEDQPGVWVRSAVPNVPASSFTVHLSKPVSAPTSVAWFIVN